MDRTSADLASEVECFRQKQLQRLNDIKAAISNERRSMDEFRASKTTQNTKVVVAAAAERSVQSIDFSIATASPRREGGSPTPGKAFSTPSAADGKNWRDREAQITARERRLDQDIAERTAQELERLRTIEERDLALRRRQKELMELMDDKAMRLDEKSTGVHGDYVREKDRLEELQAELKTRQKAHDELQAEVSRRTREVAQRESAAHSSKTDSEIRMRSLDQREAELEERLLAVQRREQQQRDRLHTLEEKERELRHVEDARHREAELRWKKHAEVKRREEERIAEETIKFNRLHHALTEQEDQLRSMEINHRARERALEEREREVTRRDTRQRDNEKRALENLRRDIEDRERQCQA
eukprot:PhM_4_TR18126/c0_g2_i1/m.33510